MEISMLKLFAMLVALIPTRAHGQIEGSFLVLGGALTAFFIQDAEDARRHRSNKMFKLDIGASENSRQVALSIFVTADWMALARHNQSFTASNRIDSLAQEVGTRYFLWKRFFAEIGLYHALRREKTYLSFPSNNYTARLYQQVWTGTYESYGNYFGLGAEAQFGFFSVGVVALQYHALRVWQESPATAFDLDNFNQAVLQKSNQRCQDAYLSRLEASLTFGVAI